MSANPSGDRAKMDLGAFEDLDVLGIALAVTALAVATTFVAPPARCG